MDLKLKGKNALVCGASQGLGKAIAKALCEEGAHVAIVSRNEENLRKTTQEIGAEYYFGCDFSVKGQVKTLLSRVEKKLSSVDILVTNTGGPPKAEFLELSAEQWQDSFQNLWMSTVELIQAVLPEMKTRKWGRVLLLTSLAAKEPLSKLTVSNSLRAGLLGLMKTLSLETAAFGVTVNALMPGFMDTERLRELGILSPIISQIPLQRLGRPEELAWLTAFLASEKASYITGQAIACDGGYLKGY